MGYEIFWYIEKHVIKEVYSGDLTLEEMRQANDEIQALVDASDLPLVHAIVDTTDLGTPNMNINAIRDAFSVLGDPRFGWLLIYGINNRTIRMIASIIPQFFQLRFRIVESEDVAIAFLRDVDVTLEGKTPVGE
jgi:hypothetical protein